MLDEVQNRSSSYKILKDLDQRAITLLKNNKDIVFGTLTLVSMGWLWSSIATNWAKQGHGKIGWFLASAITTAATIMACTGFKNTETTNSNGDIETLRLT